MNRERQTKNAATDSYNQFNGVDTTYTLVDRHERLVPIDRHSTVIMSAAVHNEPSTLCLDHDNEPSTLCRVRS